MRPLLLAALLVLSATLAAGPTQAIPLHNAVFVDARGPHDAEFRWSGECNGPVRITVVVQLEGGATEVRTADGTSTMVPDLCSIACLDRPLPFVWVIEADGVLAGGGLVAAGAVASLQGSFQDGFLEVRFTPLL